MVGGHQAVANTKRRRTDARSASALSAEALAPIQTKPLPGTALCMVLVGAAIALGGGGTVNPQTELILQVLTAIVLIPLFASPRWQKGLGHVPLAIRLLAGLVLVLPVLHLVPLPPSIWQGLPGREIERQSLALIGAENTWMPLSMAPARTFASLLAMICPVLLMMQVSRLSVRGRNWLCITIIGAGVVSLLLGALQLSHTAGWNWSPYSHISEGYLVGFQANRNAQADFLLYAMLALGVVVATRLSDGRHHALTWAVFLFLFISFLIGLLMTGSRTGIALILPTLATLGLMLWPTLQNRKAALLWLGGIFGVVITGAAAVSQLQSVQKVADRFFLTKEARWDLWSDTWFAIQQVWPYGSGIGTIVPMLEAAEQLDVVDTTRPVRAHNDWLEWYMEAGVPGLIVLGIIAILLCALAARGLMTSFRPNGNVGRRAQVLFGCGVMVICALHSVMDYPLRSMALAALTAMAVAFLPEPAAVQRSKSQNVGFP